MKTIENSWKLSDFSVIYLIIYIINIILKKHKLTLLDDLTNE
jgi:hypothetical protein